MDPKRTGSGFFMQRFALTGLLLVCILLVLLLGMSSLWVHRAANRAARDVLHRRAEEAASTFFATARLFNAQWEEEKLQQLVKEMSNDMVSFAVVNGEGKVIAASGPEHLSYRRGETVPVGWELIRDLRFQQTAHRYLNGGAYEYWRPLVGPAWRGIGAKRFFQKWIAEKRQSEAAQAPRSEKRALTPDPAEGPETEGPPEGPPPEEPRLEGPPPEAFGFSGKKQWNPMFHEPQALRSIYLLRVVVPAVMARSLIGPMRIMMITAALISVLLLSLGLAFHRAAKTAQAAEAELQKKKELSTLGEMAAVLAHEIRTPLASIKGNAQLIAERMSEDPGLQSIVKESGRLERLVNGLLDYARPNHPRRQQVDPDELIKLAAEIGTPQAQLYKVSLILDSAHRGACLWADPDQLLQVLVNLLVNAIEAAAQRGKNDGTVVLQTRRDGHRVLFEVKDNGPGLRGENPEQLFKPFYTTKPQGTGLGLSIARRIVEAHGGTITLGSRKDEGACAVITLPCVEDS